MARHNREAGGTDQRGFDYVISYQPDWLRHVKVTRVLDSGRQSTKSLFVNPDPPLRRPGHQVRTAIRCAAQGLDFEVAVTSPGRSVRRVVVEAEPKSGGPVQFSIEGWG